MLYPFMTLEDETEIVHSEPLTVDGKEKVKVVIEQPVTGGFHSAVCWLPDYTWEKIEGFSKEEINQYQEFIESVSHVIIELARDGGFDRASGFNPATRYGTMLKECRYIPRLEKDRLILRKLLPV